MTTRTQPAQFTVEHVKDIAIVRFALPEVLHVEVNDSVGDRLFALVEDDHCRRLLLNLSRVYKLSSSLLGRLTALNKLLLPLDGQLALCGLEPEVQHVIELCQLQRLLHIYPSEAEALRGLYGEPSDIQTASP